MPEPSAKIKTLTVKSRDDLNKWLKVYPEIVIFSADHEVKMVPKKDFSENEIIFVESNGEFWRKHIDFPASRYPSDIIKEFQECYDLVIGGALVIFNCEPSHDISLVSSLYFAGSLYCRCISRSQKCDRGEPGYKFPDNPLDGYDIQGKPVKMCMPLVVGYSSNEGIHLKYRQGGKYLRWTAYLNLTAAPLIARLQEIAVKYGPPLVKTEDEEVRLLDAYDRFLGNTISVNDNCKYPSDSKEVYFRNCIKKAEAFWRNVNLETLKSANCPMDTTLKDIHDKYRDDPVVKLCLQMPQQSMLSPINASKSFEDDTEFLVIDKDRFGWPVAVARKIGDGGVVFIPASVEWESLEEKLNYTKRRYPILRGWDLLKKSFSSIEPCRELPDKHADNTGKNYTLQIVLPPDAAARDARYFIKNIKVQFDEDDAKNVEFDMLLKFLVICFHSKTGGVIMFCSDKVWDKCISDKKKYAKVMALNSSNVKIPVAIQLYSIGGKKLEPSSYFDRIVSAVLFGTQRWDEDGRKILDEIFVHGTWEDPHNDKISYSTRKLNLRLIIPDAFFDGLMKYKNDIAELKAAPSGFLKELKSALNPPLK